MAATSTVRKFTFDVGWVFIGQVIIMLMGFLLKVLLGRFIGADGLGLYTMAFTVYSLAALAGGIGIPAAIVKFGAEYKDDRGKLNSFMSCAFTNSIIFGIIVGFILFFLSGMIANLFHMPELTSLIKIVAIALPFLVLNNTLLLGLLPGLREMKLYGIGIACRSILLLGLAVLFVMIGWGAKGAVLAIMFAEIGTFILSLFLTRKRFNFSLQSYLQTTKILIPFGVQLFLAGTIWMVNINADRLFVGYFLTDTAVGIYAIAIAAAGVFRMIPGIISTVTYPMMSEYNGKGMHQANELLINKVMKYVLIIQSMLGILIIFFAPDIIFWLLGAEFLPAVIPLTILILGTIFFGSVAAVGSAFSAAGRPDLAFKVNLVMLAPNLGLDILLIPKLGITGAAIGTATAMLIGVILDIYLFRSALKVRLDVRLYFQVLLLIAAMIAIFFIFQNWINPYVIAGVLFVIYSAVAIKFLLKSEGREELMNLIRQIL